MAFVHVAGNPVPEGAEELWLEGRGGLKLRALVAPALGPVARGTILLCSGRTEFLEKYFEVISDLQKRGFAVFSMDWRGQGLSDREAHNPLKGHLETFDDPVSDLAGALKEFAPRLPRPHIVLAHSMGSAIALRALQTRRIEADAAMFCSPMWGVAAINDLARSLSRFMHAVGAGKVFAPGVDTKWKKENWKRSTVTHDRERHARAQGLILEDTRLALAGPTFGWIAAAAAVFEGFAQPRAFAHLKMPMTILTAGKELLVDNTKVAEVAAMLPGAQFMVVPDAKHELMMEVDEYRDQFWTAFDALAAQVAPQTVS